MRLEAVGAAPPGSCTEVRDRPECALDLAGSSSLTNPALHNFAQNQIWCALVVLAADLLAWTQLLALTGHPARRWKPKRLRLRLLSAAGRLATSGRRVTLHLARTEAWTRLLLDALARLRALPALG